MEKKHIRHINLFVQSFTFFVALDHEFWEGLEFSSSVFMPENHVRVP